MPLPCSYTWYLCSLKKLRPPGRMGKAGPCSPSKGGLLAQRLCSLGHRTPGIGVWMPLLLLPSRLFFFSSLSTCLQQTENSVSPASPRPKEILQLLPAPRKPNSADSFPNSHHSMREASPNFPPIQTKVSGEAAANLPAREGLCSPLRQARAAWLCAAPQEPKHSQLGGPGQESSRKSKSIPQAPVQPQIDSPVLHFLPAPQDSKDLQGQGNLPWPPSFFEGIYFSLALWKPTLCCFLTLSFAQLAVGRAEPLMPANLA